MSSKKILRNLPSHWSGKNIDDFANAVIAELDLFVTETNNVKKTIQLGTADGIYLDAIGQIFGLGRNTGETDLVFRSRIKSFWTTINSSGTSDDIKSVISRVTGIATSGITVTDISPAKIKIQFDVGTNFDLINTAGAAINSSKASGVYTILEATSSTVDTTTTSDIISVSITILDRTYGLLRYGTINSTY